MPAHLYVHIPFCDGKCDYCGFYSVLAEPRLIALYPALPAAELALELARVPALAAEPVKTLYLGGGTPALLGADGLRALAASLAARLPLDSLEEWTVELNPASVTADLLREMRALGVSRLSIGVQSLDDAVLARIGRRHSAARARAAVRLAREAGFDDIGIDLIAGLPGVTPTQWRETLAQAAALNLTHLSVYALSVESGTALARRAAAGLRLPDDDAQLDALDAAETALGEAGYVRYEISNYALPGFECRHNLGVWHGRDYLGLGPAASSRYGRARWTNAPDLGGYIAELAEGRPPPREEETLGAEDDACERASFALRLRDGIDPLADAERFPALRDRAEIWERRLERLARHGIAERGGRRWRLTARGREICDAAVRELLAPP